MLKNKFETFISENLLFHTNEKIVLAFSSGIDSVVLAKLLFDSKINFAIAHCNFRLRGKDSDADEEFAREVAAKYKVHFFSIQFDTKKIAKTRKQGIQEVARNLRYEWFEKLRAEVKFDKIATAHHLNDSIETFFINVIRGTGIAGLKGITKKNNHIVRPLLFASREEIEKFARTKKIKWREDVSNASDDYLRNRIRHHLIPFLKEEQKDFEQSMARSLDMFGFIHQIQNTFVAEWKEKFITTSNEGFYLIPLKEIEKDEQPAALLSTILYSFGIITIQSEKVLKSGSGKIFKSKGFTLLHDRKMLILKIDQVQKNRSLFLSTFPDTIKIGTHSYNFQLYSSSKLRGIPHEENVEVLDAGKLKLPLQIRPWQAGDFFYPLGMSRKKKVSDFLIDKKVNRFEKEMINVLLSGNDIVCILGLRIDNRFKIDQETTTVLQIEKNNE